MYDVAYIELIRDFVYRKTGKTYFRHIRDGREDILVTCPKHKEGQERHPSCGFSKIDKENISAGIFHCFNCGFTGDTHTVLKEILGDKYDKEEASKALGIEDIEFERRLNNNAPLFTIPDLPKYVSESELKRYRVYPDYIRDRGISVETAIKFDIGLDVYTQEVTFPIRDKTGRALAVGRRSVVGKKYDYPLGFQKPLYGVYELPSIISGRYVWVVEGPFNLWSLKEYGKIGVALLGTGTRNQLEELLTINCKGFILALDGDEAGRKGNMKIADFLRGNRSRKDILVACVPDYEDINSMSKELFDQMEIKSYWDWYWMVQNRFYKNNQNQEQEDEQEFEEDID